MAEEFHRSYSRGARRAEDAVGEIVWPLEEPAGSEALLGSNPGESCGFMIDSALQSCNFPPSPSIDWTQLLIGNHQDRTLQAMQQDHLSSKNNLSHEPFLDSSGFQMGTAEFDRHGFLVEDFLNEEFPCQTSNFPPEDSFSSQDSVKAKRSTVKKNESGVALPKKPRMESLSPLPSFKVRKEKLGDRITALQQLVSPFGKTDTASVLYEAIEYIKLLHEQVGILSSPYMKLGASMQHKQEESDRSNKNEEPRRDLQSRGLCLVPVSNTISAMDETTRDFWTPAYALSYKLERCKDKSA
ncbi:uncharacterized protein LOC144716475 isoform X3 [Wolffia australiana]